MNHKDIYLILSGVNLLVVITIFRFFLPDFIIYGFNTGGWKYLMFFLSCFVGIAALALSEILSYFVYSQENHRDYKKLKLSS